MGGKLDALLQAIGFTHLIDKKTTPKLAFYVLKRERYDVKVEVLHSSSAFQSLPIPKKESMTEIRRKELSELETVELTSRPSKKAKHKDSGDIQAVSVEVPVAVSWKELVQAAVAISGAKQNVLDFFCKDVSLVPPKEFCISMSSVLDSAGQAQKPVQSRQRKGNGKCTVNKPQVVPVT